MTMYTFPAREGRSLSVNLGGHGGMNWDKVEMGGFRATNGMTFEDVQQLQNGCREKCNCRWTQVKQFKRCLYTGRDVHLTDDFEA